MRAVCLAAALALGALVAADAAGAAGPPRIGPVGTTSTPAAGTDAPSLVAALSTSRAGATRVVLTLRLRTELVCGQPGPAALVVLLPAGAGIPATLPRSSVLVDGRTPAEVTVAGLRVTVSPARAPGVTCHSIALGTIVIRFTHAAQLRNPSSPGSYAIAVGRGTARYRARLQIVA